MMRIGTYSFRFRRLPWMFFSYFSRSTECRFFSFSFFGEGGAK